MTNPLIAPRVDSTTPTTGIYLVEDIELLVSGFKSGDWIDITIGGFATSMDALATIVDPFGQIAASGIAWLIEHVAPLSDALDFLQGDPDQINAYAQTWRNAASAVSSAGFDLQNAVDRDTIDWSGATSEAYRAYINEQLGAIDALRTACEALGDIVEGVGLFVALARGIVRDIIAQAVATLLVRVPVWLAEEGLSLGLATPLVIAQVGTVVANFAAKIARVVRGVINSIKRLLPVIRRLDEIIKALRVLLGRLARRGARTPHTPHTPHTPGGPHTPHVPHRPRTSSEVDEIVEGIMEADTPQPGETVSGGRGARGTAGEQAMGFHYSQEKGWAFLEGPSGTAGHASNAHGFDGVAFTTEGPLEIHILDNKSLAREGNVSSATALSDNLEQNIRSLETRANDPRMNDVPRIGEIREQLAAARQALDAGQPLPPGVHLVVTAEGGRSTGVTGRLAQQGVEFRPPNDRR